MILVLMRHGIAEELGEVTRSPGEPLPTDRDRALTELGKRRVRRAAIGLKKIGVRASIVVHSGLVRARQTAELAAAVIAPRGSALVETAALVPEADPDTFCRLLASWREHAALLAVGHLPHLDSLVARLCGAPDRLVTELGKAAAIAFDVPTSGRPVGTLLWYLPPKLLRQLGRP